MNLADLSSGLFFDLRSDLPGDLSCDRNHLKK
jgi:hypothetical protein